MKKRTQAFGQKIASFFTRFSKRAYWRFLVGLLAAVLVLDVVFHLVQTLTPGVETLPVRTGTLYETLTADAYVLRDERLMVESGTWRVLPAVADGERVRIGDTVAYLYPMSVAESQVEYLIALQDAKRILSTAEESRADKVSESVHIRISGLLGKIEGDTQKGDIASANRRKKELAALLLCREKLADAEFLSQAEKTMDQEIALATAALGAYAKEVKATEPGWISFDWDGWEQTAMTPLTAGKEELDDLFEQTPVSGGGTTVGRFLTDFSWYVVAKVGREEAAALLAGRKYNLTLDGQTLSLTLSRMAVATDGNGVTLVFSSTELAKGLNLPRINEMSLTLSSHTGLVLPASALTENNGVFGVYILRGFLVEFRTLSVVYREGATIVTDPEYKSNGSYKVLAENDYVIVKGNDLYEGKIVQ